MGYCTAKWNQIPPKVPRLGVWYYPWVDPYQGGTKKQTTQLAFCVSVCFFRILHVFCVFFAPGHLCFFFQTYVFTLTSFFHLHFLYGCVFFSCTLAFFLLPIFLTLVLFFAFCLHFVCILFFVVFFLWKMPIWYNSWLPVPRK